MPKLHNARLAFVRALLSGEDAVSNGTAYVTTSGLKLAVGEVQQLISCGAISGNSARCGATGTTRNWVKRQMLGAEPFRAQHGEIEKRQGLSMNISESPVARLAVARGEGGIPFLGPHHVEAAERFRRLVERAALQPRVTMNYAPAATNGTGSGAGDVSDMASDARKELSRIHGALPADCASIAMDVCGLLKGLQQVEIERGWPRRSGKLVLRIALEALAAHFGLGAQAIGLPSSRSQTWRGEGAKPTRFE